MVGWVRLRSREEGGEQQHDLEDLFCDVFVCCG